MSIKKLMIGIPLLSVVGFGSFILAKEGRLRSSKVAAAVKEIERPAKPVKAQVVAPGLKGTQDVKLCYDTFLARRPLIDHGHVTVHWKINHEGKISYLELAQTDIPDKTFMGCILDKIRGARFPAPKERVGVLISHKFKFKRSDSGHASF